MKKSVSVLLASLFALTLAAGCTSSSNVNPSSTDTAAQSTEALAKKPDGGTTTTEITMITLSDWDL